jgi:non-heme Fe2+,alpha-ketoglutarate-dependent halogenase
MLVCGEDKYGHFDLIEPPAAERDAAALAVHQHVSDQYRKNYDEQLRRHEQNFAM